MGCTDRPSIKRVVLDGHRSSNVQQCVRQRRLQHVRSHNIRQHFEKGWRVAFLSSPRFVLRQPVRPGWSAAVLLRCGTLLAQGYFRRRTFPDGYMPLRLGLLHPIEASRPCSSMHMFVHNNISSYCGHCNFYLHSRDSCKRSCDGSCSVRAHDMPHAIEHGCSLYNEQ